MKTLHPISRFRSNSYSKFLVARNQHHCGKDIVFDFKVNNGNLLIYDQEFPDDGIIYPRDLDWWLSYCGGYDSYISLEAERFQYGLRMAGSKYDALFKKIHDTLDYHNIEYYKRETV